MEVEEALHNRGPHEMAAHRAAAVARATKKMAAAIAVRAVAPAPAEDLPRWIPDANAKSPAWGVKRVMGEEEAVDLDHTTKINADKADDPGVKKKIAVILREEVVDKDARALPRWTPNANEK